MDGPAFAACFFPADTDPRPPAIPAPGNAKIPSATAGLDNSNPLTIRTGLEPGLHFLRAQQYRESGLLEVAVTGHDFDHVVCTCDFHVGAIGQTP